MPTAIIQARMNSTRLPGKVLLPILGKPMLWWTIEALKKSPVIDQIVLAIPATEENDCLIDFAMEYDIECFTAWISENNVLERFYLCSEMFPDGIYFRATGDNPIIDYENPKRIYDFLRKNSLRYCEEYGLPIGAGIEVFTREALEFTYQEAKSDYDKEHVTAYMLRKKGNETSFRLIEQKLCYLQMFAQGKNFAPELSLTVDTTEDYKKIQMIMANTHRDGIPPIEKVIEFCRDKGIK